MSNWDKSPRQTLIMIFSVIAFLIAFLFAQKLTYQTNTVYQVMGWGLLFLSFIIPESFAIKRLINTKKKSQHYYSLLINVFILPFFLFSPNSVNVTGLWSLIFHFVQVVLLVSAVVALVKFYQVKNAEKQ